MKKVLALLVVLMFATSAFAIVGTQTKLNSEAGYPVVLTTDNIIIGSTFVQKIGDFGQIVGLEYLGALAGYTFIKSGNATIGLSASPSFPSVTGETSGVPNDMFGLMWANGSGLGLGLFAGFTNVNTGFVTANALYNHAPDSNYDNRSQVSLLAGMTMGTLDLGLRLTDSNRTTGDINHFDPSGNAQSKNLDTWGEITANLNARTEIMGMLCAANVQVALGNSSVGNKVSVGDDGNYTTVGDTDTITKRDVTNLTVGLLAGKTLKATESLKVLFGTGLNFNMYADAQTSYEDLITKTKTYGPMGLTTSHTYIRIPLNVAVEGKLNETWKINAGVALIPVTLHLQGQNNRTSAAVAGPGLAWWNQGNLDLASAMDYGIGVTGIFGDVQLDVRLNPTILLNGPNFISGNTTGPLAFNFALVYGWK